MLSLKEAAEAVGLGKPAVLKAIQKGRISAKKNELGEWEIDPAELHRVYKPVSRETLPKKPSERQELDTTPQETVLLQRDLHHATEKIAALQADLERERTTATDTIDDLRRRLDAEGEERRRTQAQLTALLTDQRERTQQAASAPASKRKWFSWR